METQALFFVLAAALVVLVLAATLPSIWREARRQPGAAGARRHAWIMTASMVLGLPALAFGFYSLRGDPAALGGERSVLSGQLLQQGLPEPGAASQRLYGELEQHLNKQPGDGRALVLKARLEMRGERYAQAAQAFEQALAGTSRAALDPALWVEFAEARAMAQGGSLAGEPLRLVHRALALDAGHAQALDLAGSAAWEGRDYAGAAAHWKRLLEKIPAGSARHGELALAIERAQLHASLALPARP